MEIFFRLVMKAISKFLEFQKNDQDDNHSLSSTLSINIVEVMGVEMHG